MMEQEILKYIGKNPYRTRGEIARTFGMTYWRARYLLDRMTLEGKLERIEKWITPRIRRVVYKIARHKLGLVMSFKFFWIIDKEEGAARKLFRSEEEWSDYRRELCRRTYKRECMVRERWVEFLVRVDKPKAVFIEPKYVVNYLIDFSSWTFAYGGVRAKKIKPGERFPGERYWIEGREPERASEYEKCELKVSIFYTDYNYPHNSFHRELFIENCLDMTEDKLKAEVAGEVIKIAGEEFKWLGKY